MLGITAGVLLVAAAACSSEETTGPEMPDAALAMPSDAVPAPPELLPCRPGYHERVSPGGTTYCHPYGEGGRTECPEGQGHFPGTEGCEAIGTPCPLGDFPPEQEIPGDPDLPPVYVLAGAEGGDGTRARPFGSIADALGGEPAGRYVLAKGRYDEPRTNLGDLQELVGVCVAETEIAGAVYPAPGAAVRNLRVLHVETQASNSGRKWVEAEGVEVVHRFRARGQSIRIRRSVLRGSVGLSALSLDERATVELEDVILASGSSALAEIGTGGGQLSMTDVAGSPSPSDFASPCIDAASGSLHADGLLLSGCNGGILVTGGVAIVRDLVVEGSQALSASGPPRALSLEEAASSLARVVLIEPIEIGVAVLGGSLEASDLLIEDSQALPNGTFGDALSVSGGARVRVHRVAIEGSHRVGVIADGETTAVLSDLRIADVRSRPADGRFGYGLTVQGRSDASLHRVEVQRARGFGVLAAGSQVFGQQVRVSDTAAFECATSACPDTAYGMGIGVIQQARVELAGVDVVRSTLCGLYVGTAGDLEARGGSLGNNPVGACVDRPDFDTGRIELRFVDNEQAFEAPQLPVPPLPTAR